MDFPQFKNLSCGGKLHYMEKCYWKTQPQISILGQPEGTDAVYGNINGIQDNRIIQFFQFTAKDDKCKELLPNICALAEIIPKHVPLAWGLKKQNTYGCTDMSHLITYSVRIMDAIQKDAKLYSVDETVPKEYTLSCCHGQYKKQ